MYKKPSELIDREEYLLGRAIDKSFDLINGDLGGKSDICKNELLTCCLYLISLHYIWLLFIFAANVPPRILSKSDCKEQVDIAKKIHEDPLYAIKQKEMEARKKLLSNPVKLKQIKQMVSGN